VASLDTILGAYISTLAEAIPRVPSGQVTYNDVLPGVPNLPMIAAYPTDGPYSLALGPGQDDTYNIAVACLVSVGTDGSGQRDLRALIDGAGPYSIRKALVLASKRRVEGQLAALGVPHLRVSVGRFDSWGIRFAQVSVDHLGVIVRTTAVTWAPDQDGI
jgi:hypothetical protein